MPRQVFTQNALSVLGRHDGTAAAPGSYTSRTKHYVRATGFGLRLYWSLAYPTAAATQEVAYSGTTSIKCSIELADGTIIPAWFNGVRTASGVGGSIVVTDPIGVVLTAGDYIWIRVYIANATSLYINDYNDWPRGEGYIATNDYADSGTVPASGGYAFKPNMATLQVQELDNGVVFFGDSIVAASVDALGYGGFLTRAFGPTHPTLNMASSAEGVANFLVGSQAKNRLALAGLSGAEYVVLSWTNDPYGARTLSQYQADILTCARMVRKMGMKVFVCTLTPRTTSTDGWKTLANQTIITPAYDTVRLAINDWLRREFRDDSLFGIIDTAAAVEDASRWKEPAAGIDVSGTITSTVTGTITDATKTWTTNQWIGYVGRNDTLGGNPSTITRSGVTTAGTGGAAVFTVGNTYSIYGGLTVDGIHPSGEGHRVMSAGIPPSVILP